MKDLISKKRVPTKGVTVLEEVSKEKKDGSMLEENEELVKDEGKLEDGTASTCKFVSVSVLEAGMEARTEDSIGEEKVPVGEDPVLQYLSRFSKEETRTMIFSVGTKNQVSAKDVAELTVVPVLINGV
jgi:hypothetical protein